MPSRNRRKLFVSNSYFHIYNRGVEKRKIFLDDSDYAVYLHLLKRYLGDEPEKDVKGREYPNFNGAAEIVAFCLMPNHYHFLLYVIDETVISQLWQSINGSYVTYFNKKYQRVGPLFQDRFKASHILEEAYLQHISRYIHLNPKQWRTWKYSSLPYYIDGWRASWCHPTRCNSIATHKYLEYLQDYDEYRTTLDDVKRRLA